MAKAPVPPKAGVSQDSWGLPSHCPKCGVSFKGTRIPLRYRKHYEEGATHFSLLIGQYDMVQDRTVAWTCYKCKQTWKR